MRKYLIILTFVLSLLFIQLAPSYAATCTAQATSNWETAATWTGCGGGTPLPGDDVVIPSGFTVTINFGVLNLGTTTIDNGGTLVIASAGFINLVTLTNNGTIINHALIDNFSLIDNYGTIVNNGTFSNSAILNHYCLSDFSGNAVINGGGVINILPCISNAPTDTTSPSQVGPAIDPSMIPPDDRLNYGKGDVSHGIVYARSDNGITIYGINPDSTGYLAVHVAPEDLPTCDPTPSENQLLASSADGKYTVWLLATCEFQVNMGPDAEGKVQVITWRGVPAIKESVTSYDFNVFEVLGG